MNILANIEAIRKEKRMNQDVLAELLGVKQNTYSQYINRSNDIPFKRLSQIADKLGVSVIDIITYPERYVPKSEICKACADKEEIIITLNKYIKILEKK
ncbi:MAG: helix-turn-helix domain-containing protein [Prevotellaceae bacterium]|jgi:transcriptional regulator with XRE-family HTH domain|nr:helix-turn-helix domain-containing protein [Prevotellaceae bacterium]